MKSGSNNHYYKKKIKDIYILLTNFPGFFSNKLNDFKDQVNDFKYRITNFKESNLELGMYHLQMNNLNDAIMRFALIDKFVEPNDDEANYWLGWCYYLKGNINKAIISLTKTKTIEALELRNYIQNVENIDEIPESIWMKQRELTNYISNLKNPIYSYEYAINFVKILIRYINILPDTYNVLEIGYNNNFIAEELKKRMPIGINITIVEPSLLINEHLENYYSNNYDNIVLESTTEFLENNNQKFDIIFSSCGVSHIKNLNEIYKQIYNNLAPEGYFALVVLSNNADLVSFSMVNKEYTYNHSMLNQLFEKNNFIILHSAKLPLEINNNYYIIIGQKV